MIARLLRIFFQLLYHQFAWTYDFVAWAVSLGRWRSWVLGIIDLVDEDSPILELGHGPGHLQLALNQQGVSTLGLDESRWMSQLAYARLERNNVSPKLVNGCAEGLPFANGSIQQVVSTFPSEYIFSPDTLAEIYRVLAPGGCLITMPFAWITGSRWYESFAAWLFQVTGQSPRPDMQEIGEKLKRPFDNAGFDVVLEIRTLPSSMVLIIRAKKNVVK